MEKTIALNKNQIIGKLNCKETINIRCEIIIQKHTFVSLNKNKCDQQTDVITK